MTSLSAPCASGRRRSPCSALRCLRWLRGRRPRGIGGVLARACVQLQVLGLQCGDLGLEHHDLCQQGQNEGPGRGGQGVPGVGRPRHGDGFHAADLLHPYLSCNPTAVPGSTTNRVELSGPSPSVGWLTESASRHGSPGCLSVDPRFAVELLSRTRGGVNAHASCHGRHEAGGRITVRSDLFERRERRGEHGRARVQRAGLVGVVHLEAVRGHAVGEGGVLAPAVRRLPKRSHSHEGPGRRGTAGRPAPNRSCCRRSLYRDSPRGRMGPRAAPPRAPRRLRGPDRTGRAAAPSPALRGGHRSSFPSLAGCGPPARTRQPASRAPGAEARTFLATSESSTGPDRDVRLRPVPNPLRLAAENIVHSIGLGQRSAGRRPVQGYGG